MPNKIEYFSQKCVFISGKNAYALFTYFLRNMYDFVWRQSELCVFRAPASVGRIFIFGGIVMKKILILIFWGMIMIFMSSCFDSVDNFTAEAYNELTTPCIVPTVYETDDVVVADIIATQSPYNADPTGKEDSTEAIQRALDDCSKMGGGTVFLPVGVYKVTESVRIPAFVTLRGDWQDPDLGSEYGTVIKACPKPSNRRDNGLFILGGSGGVLGLTVFYPEQWLYGVEESFSEGVIQYEFTFYADGIGANYMLPTVKNVTVLNGYRGIGACCNGKRYPAHEQLIVENFKGTFLDCGMEIYNSADVGTMENISISSPH